MSKDFEESVSTAQKEAEIIEAVLKDREAQRQLALENPFDGIDLDGEDGTGNPTTFDLRSEVDSQLKLLKSIRKHFFHPNGQPKPDTEASDITSYMANTTKLLSMLKGFEDALKTDADVLKIETAIEMALEDSPCEEFVAALTKYLEEDLST